MEASTTENHGVIPCPNCGAYLSVSESLCWRCGEMVPVGFHEGYDRHV